MSTTWDGMKYERSLIPPDIEPDKCGCGNPVFDGEKYCEQCRMDRNAMEADDRRDKWTGC